MPAPMIRLRIGADKSVTPWKVSNPADIADIGARQLLRAAIAPKIEKIIGKHGNSPNFRTRYHSLVNRAP